MQGCVLYTRQAKTTVLTMNYDFIEIGTSDFETLVQTCAAGAIGICVEPVKYYLDKLPTVVGVEKIHAAISYNNEERESLIYYVSPDEIQKNNLPLWLKGCNCIDGYHPQHRMLGVEALVIKEKVKQIPIKDILKKATAIHVLKIDTEGSDCDILIAAHNAMTSGDSVFPKQIIFECNSLTCSIKLGTVLSAFCISNYSIEKRGDNVFMAKR